MSQLVEFYLVNSIIEHSGSFQKVPQYGQNYIIQVEQPHAICYNELWEILRLKKIELCICVYYNIPGNKNDTAQGTDQGSLSQR